MWVHICIYIYIHTHIFVCSIRTLPTYLPTYLPTWWGRLVSLGAFVARPSAEKCGRRSIF